MVLGNKYTKEKQTMKQKVVMLLIIIAMMIGGLWGVTFNGTFNKMTASDTVTEGYYIIVANDAYAMLASHAGTWVDQQDVTISNNQVTNPTNSIIWHVQSSGTGWAFRNLENDLYIRGTSTSTATQGISFVTGQLSSLENSERWEITWNSGTGGDGSRIASMQVPARSIRRMTSGTTTLFRFYTHTENNTVTPVLFKFEGEVIEATIEISDVTTFTSPPPANADLEISATVTNAEDVWLQYWINGEDDLTDEFDLNGDVYTFTIPQTEFTDGDRVEYQILAWDSDDNFSESNVYVTPFIGTTPIFKARANNADGTAKHFGALVRVEGVVLNDKDMISNYITDFFMQDETGGIGVFLNTANTFPDAVIGHKFIVKGTIGQFRGRTQITPTLITDLGKNVPPAPYVGTVEFFITYDTAEDYEGSLIMIKDIDLAAGATWPTSGETIGVNLTDGTGNIELRVLPALHGETPTFPADIVAILSQNTASTSPPHHNAYQLFIRTLEDITPLSVLPVSITSFTASGHESVVQLRWVSEAEVNMSGYNVFRGVTDDMATAMKLNGSMILAANNSEVQEYNFVDNNTQYGVLYYYWIQSLENDGSAEFFGPVSIMLVNPTEPEPEIFHVTRLSSVYPNPMRTNTIANFDVSVKSEETANLKIFNIRGQLVREFTDIAPGNHNITWDGRDRNNRETSSGIYFYQLSSPSYSSTHKMIILN